MIHAESHTSRWGERRWMHLALWAAVIACGVFSGGCATTHDQRSSLSPVRPATQHPAIMVTTTNEPVRAAASNELGRETAAAIPTIERPAPRPVDPGAAALLNSMLSRMSDRVVGPDDVTRIGLSQLRNQSRAPAIEFEKFCARLAGVLNHAANDARGARF